MYFNNEGIGLQELAKRVTELERKLYSKTMIEPANVPGWGLASKQMIPVIPPNDSGWYYVGAGWLANSVSNLGWNNSLKNAQNVIGGTTVTVTAEISGTFDAISVFADGAASGASTCTLAVEIDGVSQVSGVNLEPAVGSTARTNAWSASGFNYAGHSVKLTFTLFRHAAGGNVTLSFYGISMGRLIHNKNICYELWVGSASDVFDGSGNVTLTVTGVTGYTLIGLDTIQVTSTTGNIRDFVTTRTGNDLDQVVVRLIGGTPAAAADITVRGMCLPNSKFWT